MRNKIIVKYDYLRELYPFASRLNLPAVLGFSDKRGLQFLTEKLKKDYCFNIKSVSIHKDEYKIKVYLNDKASKSEYEWVKEIYQYNLPESVSVVVV